MFELLVCGNNLDDDIDVDLPGAVDGGVVHVKPGRTTFTPSNQQVSRYSTVFGS